MITIKNLTKIFRTEELETSALSGINLQINEGIFDYGSVGLRKINIAQYCWAIG
jgi:ABC-type oligopeptide transport system ATPase subunit